MCSMDSSKDAKPSAWIVTNTRTRTTHRFTNMTKAMDFMDRKDSAHGAVICTMRAEWGA